MKKKRIEPQVGDRAYVYIVSCSQSVATPARITGGSGGQPSAHMQARANYPPTNLTYFMLVKLKLVKTLT